MFQQENRYVSHILDAKRRQVIEVVYLGGCGRVIVEKLLQPFQPREYHNRLGRVFTPIPYIFQDTVYLLNLLSTNIIHQLMCILNYDYTCSIRFLILIQVFYKLRIINRGYNDRGFFGYKSIMIQFISNCLSNR